MNSVLNAIFGLEGMGFGDPGARLSFAHPLPAWGWALVVLAVVALALWSYRGLAGPRGARAGLGIARGLVLLLVVLLISGPRLARERISTQTDAVLVLLDRSASMTLPDAGTPEAPATRDESLRAALSDHPEVWQRLGEDKDVRWFGFAGGAFALTPGGAPAGETDAPPLPDAGEPSGRRTSIGAALDEALRASAGVPISGVVIISDGRSGDEPTRETLRRLAGEQVPVFVVPVGSEDPPSDLAIARVEAPRQAFVDDAVPVRIRIERHGGAAGGPGGTVELIDRASGAVLDSAPIGPPDDDNAFEITLTAARADPGDAGWSVRLRPAGPDLVADNNTRDVDVELVDRPLRVLYLEGYPRWEHRYLKTLLLREASISSSNLLLSSSRRYLQEGDVLIDAVPSSPGEWGPYDVIILGDLRPDLFAPEQLEQIRDHVAQRGAGLLWIAGEGATPGLWGGTPLADLLPFTTGQGRAGLPAWGEPVVLARAPAAQRLGVLAMADEGDAWPDHLSDPRTGWSQLRWAQRIDPDRLKPTAEVFAFAVPASTGGGLGEASGGGTPAVVSMRFGAGRSLYVATDEIWRWRYGRGEDLTERFWLPLIRMLGRSSLARTGDGAVLAADPEEGVIGAPVQIRLDLFDQELLEAAPATVQARIQREGSAGVEIRLTRASEGGAVRARFDATWAADEPGDYAVSITEPLLAGLGLRAGVSVRWPDDERRRPETDHPLLARLAAQTGGQVLPSARLAQLPELLPNRELVIAGEPEVTTLWDRPVVLALLIVLLTLEWIGRRWIHLA